MTEVTLGLFSEGCNFGWYFVGGRLRRNEHRGGGSFGHWEGTDSAGGSSTEGRSANW